MTYVGLHRRATHMPVSLADTDDAGEVAGHLLLDGEGVRQRLHAAPPVVLQRLLQVQRYRSAATASAAALVGWVYRISPNQGPVLIAALTLKRYFAPCNP